MSLKIAVSKLSANPCALDAICQKPGISFEAALLVCQALHLTCTFSWYNGTEIGDGFQGPGNITKGLIGAIERGEFDTSLPVITPTPPRLGKVKFTSSYMYSNIILVTRAPNMQSNALNWSIVKAFQVQVWIYFICSLFIIILVLKFEFRIMRDMIAESNGSIFNMILNTLICMITQDFDQYLSIAYTSVRILIGTWLLAGLVMNSLFSSEMFRNSVLKSPKLPFTDLETFVQCLERKECSLTTPSVTLSYMQLLMIPGSDLTPRLEDVWKTNPILELPRLPSIRMMLNRKDIYLVTITSQWEFDTFYSFQNCSYYTVDLHLPDLLAFPLAKNSTYFKNLTKMGRAFREFGFNIPIEKKYSGHTQCSWKTKSFSSDNGPGKGEMLQYSAIAFYFLIIGLAVAMIAFCIELLTKPAKVFA